MGRRFVAERRRDPYYRAAQREGLRSRAAFKLQYLDLRFHLFHPRARVLDLGAAPGGWSVVAAQAVGPKGAVVAVDLRPVEPLPRVRVVRGRILVLACLDNLIKGAAGVAVQNFNLMIGCAEQTALV